MSTLRMIRLLDVAGNWSDEQPFTFDTTAEMRPLRRTSGDAVANRLPSPHRNNELFSEAQWQQEARFLAETFTAKRPFPSAFVPYDASLLEHWTFLGMPEKEVRFILGRGGQPTDLSLR
jgi:hypothetical protein